MEHEKTIQRFSEGLLNCEACDRPLNEATGLVIANQGDNPKTICSHCQLVRQVFQDVGLPLR